MLAEKSFLSQDDARTFIGRSVSTSGLIKAKTNTLIESEFNSIQSLE